MSSGPIVAFERISKSFAGVAALKDVTFQIPQGKILGLVGENGAGKSTLMNVLSGNLSPDHGRMLFQGVEFQPKNPADAARGGVSFIHQELNLFPNLTVGQNLFIGSIPRRFGFVDQESLRARSVELLNQVGLALPPETPLDNLAPGEKQLVEIAKALGSNARLILFDEPTTSLTHRETENLFQLMRRLRNDGFTLVYISHALEDLLRLCDEVVVLRDGAVVGAGAAADFSVPSLITLMVGRSLNQLFPTRQKSRSSEIVLEVSGLAQPWIAREISFNVRRGEALGIFGLMGAGRSELARMIFGLDPHESGAVKLCGSDLTDATPRERIAKGLAFLTENRREEGLCMPAAIEANLLLGSLRRFSNSMGRIQRVAALNAMTDMRAAVRLNPQVRLKQPVRTLSGGNQQKVALGKWLLTQPKALILDEPTRGIDVGAKFDIYQLILGLADQGTATLVISSEIEELIGICDAILVMREGQIKARFERGDFAREQILELALGTAG